MKRFLSMALAVCIILSAIVVGVSAEGPETYDSLTAKSATLNYDSTTEKYSLTVPEVLNAPDGVGFCLALYDETTKEWISDLNLHESGYDESNRYFHFAKSGMEADFDIAAGNYYAALAAFIQNPSGEPTVIRYPLGLQYFDAIDGRNYYNSRDLIYGGVWSISDNGDGTYTLASSDGSTLDYVEDTSVGLRLYSEEAIVADFPIELSAGKSSYILTEEIIARGGVSITEGYYHVAMGYTTYNADGNQEHFLYGLTDKTVACPIYFPEIVAEGGGDGVDMSNYYESTDIIHGVWSITYNSATGEYTITSDTALDVEEMQDVRLEFYNDSYLGGLHIELSGKSKTFTFTMDELEIPQNSIAAGNYHMALMTLTQDGETVSYGLTDKSAGDAGKLYFPGVEGYLIREAYKLSYANGKYVINKIDSSAADIPIDENIYYEMELHAPDGEHAGNIKITNLKKENGNYTFTPDDIVLQTIDRSIPAGYYNIIFNIVSEAPTVAYELTNGDSVYFDAVEAPQVEIEIKNPGVINTDKAVEDVVLALSDKSEQFLGDLAGEIVTAINGGDASILISEGLVSESVVRSIEAALANGDELKVVPGIHFEPIDSKDITAEMKGKVKDKNIARYMDLLVSIDVYRNGELDASGEILYLFGEEIEFTVQVPEELRNAPDGYNRAFSIIHFLHDGGIETIKPVENEDGTLSFSAKSFSVYALAYEDTKSEEKDVTVQEPETKPENPKTNDNIQPVLLSAVCIICAAAAVYVSKKKLHG